MKTAAVTCPQRCPRSPLAPCPRFRSLNNNRLTGPFPEAIANNTYPWPTLQYIFFQYNQLTGPIPNTFFGPEKKPPFSPDLNLKTLCVHGSALHGPTRARARRHYYRSLRAHRQLYPPFAAMSSTTRCLGQSPTA